jgi:hypothetical protein
MAGGSPPGASSYRFGQFQIPSSSDFQISRISWNVADREAGVLGQHGFVGRPNSFFPCDMVKGQGQAQG